MIRDEEHIGALDGLRSAAIVLVLLYHLSPEHESDLGLRALPFKIADLGWSGVDLFFVLSGFLITGKLLAAKNEPHRFRNFYARRALRVFPLYYAALAIAFIVNRPPLHAQLSYWLYYSNFVQEPMRAVLQVGHFWSLAIEEQFYLVWPAIIFLTTPKAARRICVAIVLVAFASRYALATNGFDNFATYAWTPCRADGLALGSLLALVYADETLRPRAFRWSVVIATATAPFLAWAAWRGKAGDVFQLHAIALRTILPGAVALFFAALLVLSLEVPVLSRALTNRATRLIARYSYGMYVFHYLLYPLFLCAFPPESLAASRNLAAALFFLITASISTVLAAISYELFERRFLQWKPHRHSM